ncbi:hypothetical protein [Archangium sp.]|uniref:hypothetical protein n=1 Tax=Archangium sp. TaxID=1872627 RepID=UPI00286BD7DC|nr:hypothetical protein [Archangium sp.]
MSLEEALAADRRRDFANAIRFYEESLVHPDASVEAYLNLLVLCWQLTDYGYWTTMKVPRHILDKASSLLTELRERAKARFPNDAEVAFWDKYIQWTDLGDGLEEEECEALLQEPSSRRAPVMHLFAISGGTLYRRDALDLMTRCEAECTVRAAYIASVIRGVEERRGI